MVYMYHSFLIHSSADGHLGCFHSSLRRGHANLLCIVPILVYVLPIAFLSGQYYSSKSLLFCGTCPEPSQETNGSLLCDDCTMYRH